jgi:AcrB/AcrD/AcrF family
MHRTGRRPFSAYCPRSTGLPLQPADIEKAAIEGAVQRLRPKLMTVAAVLASLAPILWETGVGSDVMKPIAAPIVGGMITSTINVLILVPVFFLTPLGDHLAIPAAGVFQSGTRQIAFVEWRRLFGAPRY